jgi:hypothetical protein
MKLRQRRPDRFDLLYPAFLFPRCAGWFGQVAVGRPWRWLGLALGTLLAIPAFVGGLLFVPMHFAAKDRC